MLLSGDVHDMLLSGDVHDMLLSGDVHDMLLRGDIHDMLVSTDIQDMLVGRYIHDMLVSTDIHVMLVSGDIHDMLVSGDIYGILVSRNIHDMLVSRDFITCWCTVLLLFRLLQERRKTGRRMDQVTPPRRLAQELRSTTSTTHSGSLRKKNTSPPIEATRKCHGVSGSWICFHRQCAKPLLVYCYNLNWHSDST